jgi:hypothetical protein
MVFTLHLHRVYIECGDIPQAQVACASLEKSGDFAQIATEAAAGKAAGARPASMTLRMATPHFE